MKPLQVQFPPYIKQFDAYLAFLADPEEYAKLHDQIKAGITELNRLVEKLQIASEIDTAKAAAEADQQAAKQLLAETKEQAKATREECAAEQERLENVANALAQDMQALKKAVVAETARVTKHGEAMAKAQAALERQREQVARELAKARALQDEAQERLDRIQQFKEAV